MVAIAYARVSTEDQAKHGYSLPDQLASCRRKAESCGATQIIECVDEGVTGEVLARPGLEKARQLIRAGGISLFVCLDPDRLARKLSLQLLITEELDRAGIKLEFVNFDWRDTPEGRLFYSLRGAIAEYEKEKIRERTMRGKLQKARQGLLTNSPGTFGYDYVPGGKFAINEGEAAIIRLIYNLYVREGLGGQSVAARLNEMGIPSPRGSVWQKMTVKRILQNTAYTGTMYINRYDARGRKANRYLPVEQRHRTVIRPESEWVPVQVPAIIDLATFAAAQAKMREARRLRPGNAKYVYLLGGLLRCGICGRTMHGNHTQNRHGKDYRWYVCSGQAPGDPPGKVVCVNGFHRAEEVEAAVWKEIGRWLADTSIWMEALEAQEEGRPETEQQREVIEQELVEVGQERSRLLNVLQKGLVSLADIEGRLAELQGREQKLRTVLSQLAPVEVVSSTDKKSLEEWAAEWAGRYADLDLAPEEKKQVVRVVVAQVVVGPGDNLVIRPKIPGF